MGWHKAERSTAVGALNSLAATCGVTCVRRNASYRKVMAMVDAIRASPGSASSSAKLKRLVRKYDATFRVNGSAACGVPPAAGATSSQRYRGTSFLCTYNWDFLNVAFPDGTQPAVDVNELWDTWTVWVAAKVDELGVQKTTSTLEESLHATSVADRVHIHWKLDLVKPVDVNSKAFVAFHGVQPDVRATESTSGRAARGRTASVAVNAAHFYCWAPKVGTLFVDTNWEPFGKYRVLGKWLDDLWTDGKLSHEKYAELSLKVRKGHAARKRDLQAILEDERERSVDQKIADVNRDLAQLKSPFLRFRAVEEWEESFLDMRFRWQVLVLQADSASGKSSFAESLFEKPFCVTVEESEDLDLKGFSSDVHDGIVLDNVNSWNQLRRWRAALQSRNAKFKGGRSATNMYAYTQYLYGVAIVATIDMDVPDQHLITDGHPKASRWLLRNVKHVLLPAGEAFYERSGPIPRNVPNTHSLFAQTVKRRRQLPRNGPPATQ